MKAGMSTLVLVPFPVIGSLPLAVMREMRHRGETVVVGYGVERATGYAADPLDDFSAHGATLDMSAHLGRSGVAVLEEVCIKKNIGMVVQAGAPWAYPQLSRLKERRPDLKLIDMLFNMGPHFHSFASYRPIFDGVLVESRVMFDALEDGIQDTKVRQVSSGIDLGRFTPAHPSNDTASRNLILGYFGRLSPEKNPLGFISLAEKVHEALPWARFAIYGHGPQEYEVRRRLAQSPAKDTIDFHGFVEDPTTAYRQIDILSVPSLLDGRPAAVMEANACGVPVIGAPVGGIPEMIEEGQNGYVLAPRDVSRLVALMEAWRGDPSSFSALRLRSRELAEMRFDRVRMMDRYYAVLTEFLRAPARPLGSLAA